jgi:hypothetical protein
MPTYQFHEEYSIMSSVIVSWKGLCTDLDKQKELLSFINRIAEINSEYLNDEPKVPKISRMLSAMRWQGLRERDDTEFIEITVTGRIIVHSDVLADRTEFANSVLRLGLPLHSNANERQLVTCVEVASLCGTSFQLFDPRRLYPGSDRLNFVFVRCPSAPFLDGSLVSVRTGADLVEASWDVLRTADWYLECPYIHLRYVLEDWSLMLLSWVKYFFIPDLHWYSYEELQGYEMMKAGFDEQASRVGSDRAKLASFSLLLDAFREEANRWTQTFAAMSDDEDR